LQVIFKVFLYNTNSEIGMLSTQAWAIFICTHTLTKWSQITGNGCGERLSDYVQPSAVKEGINLL
jgi:hypothetical protein